MNSLNNDTQQQQTDCLKSLTKDLRHILTRVDHTPSNLNAIMSIREFLVLLRDQGAWAPTIMIDIKLNEILQESIGILGLAESNMENTLYDNV